MGDALITIVLYVAGDGPNSQTAKSNLAAKLAPLDGDGRLKTEVVDVFEKPERALEDAVFLTPTLRVYGAAFKRTLVGNLSDPRVLDDTLADCLGTVDGEAH